MPEVTPAIDSERKRIRKNDIQNEANRRKLSYVKAAVLREQDRIEEAEDEEAN